MMHSNTAIHLDPHSFLKNYWQKKPLVIRQAFNDFQSPISADELAGLSMEQNVESRIILEEGQTPWELRHGPFSEDIFRHLPESKWTLLVQAVDHWLPEVRQLLNHFCFVPSWRMDDIMISYAADGGSVGPHYDHYDVFLLQAQGKRLWKTGPKYDESSSLLQHSSLKILADFKILEEHVLEPGDMLYLPPGVGHHGIAVGECITISIGFRAPGHRDILMQFTDFIADQLPGYYRYSDPDIKPQKKPYFIDDAAINRIQEILQHYIGNKDLLHQWFGELMTEPKYCVEHDGLICDGWDELLDQICETGLELALNARIACDHSRFYANGQSFYPSSPETKQLIHKIAQQRTLSLSELYILDEIESRRLLAELVNQKVLVFRE